MVVSQWSSVCYINGCCTNPLVLRRFHCQWFYHAHVMLCLSTLHNYKYYIYIICLNQYVIILTNLYVILLRTAIFYRQKRRMLMLKHLLIFGILITGVYV
jgi:hypothetical protein